MPEIPTRYQGKRFAAFIITVAGLLLALGMCVFGGAVPIFGAAAFGISGAFAVYVGGQSTTDWKKLTNGEQ